MLRHCFIFTIAVLTLSCDLWCNHRRPRLQAERPWGIGRPTCQVFGGGSPWPTCLRLLTQDRSTTAPRWYPAQTPALPKVPPGFRVELLAEKLGNPRKIVTAPNGDLFIAESRPGRVKILRLDGEGKVASTTEYAEGLQQPFGMAFIPRARTRSTCMWPTPARWFASPTAMAI